VKILKRDFKGVNGTGVKYEGGLRREEENEDEGERGGRTAAGKSGTSHSGVAATRRQLSCSRLSLGCKILFNGP